tara:strand:- start:567 stop:851 length:285 start_codon:yes stop_codon:yes gene_type:complete
MTKQEIINKVTKQTGIDREDVYLLFEAFIQTIQESMIEGNNIYIRGFGSFINKKKAKKIARNISTNTAIIIEPHYYPTFKASKIFGEKVKKALN